jgi:hypothetical protein
MDRAGSDGHPRPGRSAGAYNSMLTAAATIRIDMPAASTVEVIAMILGDLARIETGST